MSYDKKEVECLLCRSLIMEVNFGSHLYDEHGGFHEDDYDDVRGDVRELVNDVSTNHEGHVRDLCSHTTTIIAQPRCFRPSRGCSCWLRLFFCRRMCRISPEVCKLWVARQDA